jgi:hypothetical protein
VLARRASREAKSMREEFGSEEDSDEPVEWEGDDEVSSEDGSASVAVVLEGASGAPRLNVALARLVDLTRRRCWRRREGGPDGSRMRSPQLARVNWGSPRSL